MAAARTAEKIPKGLKLGPTLLLVSTRPCRARVVLKVAAEVLDGSPLEAVPERVLESRDRRSVDLLGSEKGGDGCRKLAAVIGVGLVYIPDPNIHAELSGF